MKAKAVVRISNTGIELNDEIQFNFNADDNNSLPFKQIYNELGLTYPKFYKMDNLSKLGFLGVELLKKAVDLDTFEADRLGQVFQNSYSSLDTDVVHQQLITEGKMPSPAVFVYTLPNIVMGEIAIRNKIYGENLFTLADVFLPQKWLQLVNLQFSMNKSDAVLGGWIEIFKNNFDLRLFLIEKMGSEKGFEVH